MKLTTILAAAVLAATPALAQQEIVFGLSAEKGSLQAETAHEFARRANEKLGDKAKVVVYDSGQIGDDKDLMQKLKLGSVAIALPSSIMSSISDKFALFDMPFLVADRDHVGRIEKEIFWPEIAPTVEDKGYKVLAMWENGTRQITNNVRPIVTPADLKGIKIRTPKSTWRVKMFEAWGANPTPMPFSEVFTALQTGRHRRAGEPLHQHRRGQVQRGPEVSLGDEPRLHARLSRPWARPSMTASTPRSARCWRTRRARWSPGRATRAPPRTTRCARS